MDMDERFEMTSKSLKKLCKSLTLYTSCPELNQVIHLHQKGIQKIENLEEYSGLRTVYLECNAVSKMENLEPLVNLRCLYLNQNLVEVVEGLETLKCLEIIDLADNLITSVAGLACCPELRQLNLSGNKIRTAEHVVHLRVDMQLFQRFWSHCSRRAKNLLRALANSMSGDSIRTIELDEIKIIAFLLVEIQETALGFRDASQTTLCSLHLEQRKFLAERNMAKFMLQECTALQLLDLANNKIDDEEALEVLRSMPLRLLRLCGNPIVSIAQHYRKFTVVAMPTLNYLDESPIFEKERRFAAAFTQGGIEGEKKEREEFKKEEAEVREKNRKAFHDLTAESGDRRLQESSASVDISNSVYERLETEAKAREELELRRSSVGKTTVPFSVQPTASDAKKRAASQVGGGDEVEESPPKLMKVISDLEDEMEVEAAVCQAARDLMDLDCGDVPAKIQECAFETCDQSSVAEYNIPVDENLESQPSVMTSSAFQESLDASENPWLRLAPDEMRECVEKERQYKKNLQEKVLQKAAAGAQEAMESRQLLLLPCPGATLGEEDSSATSLHSARPVIWGSSLYRGLWAKAVSVSDDVEVGFDSPAVSTLDAIDGVLEEMSYDEQSVEQVSMMDVSSCVLLS